MDKITELLRLLTEIEQSAKRVSKWDKNYQYYQGVLDCIDFVKKHLQNEDKGV
jgi:hypothetical protein